jgi:hypothetical protein
MTKKDFNPLDRSKIKTYSISDRKSKVSLDTMAKPPRPKMMLKDFFGGLPDVLAAGELKEVIESVAKSVRNDKPVIAAMGAHVIKVGLSPLIVDLMERKVLSLVAINGAGIIHDFELAYIGSTSENVDSSIDDGTFGMAKETGEMLNSAITEGAKRGVGLGKSVGEMIEGEKLPNREISILAAGARLNIPVTVHVAIGTDIIHMHPNAAGDDIGKTSMTDFLTFASAISNLSGGVYFNIGSTVIMPEVFLKAISLARNLRSDVRDFMTVDMDFTRHYRPQTNVVKRPTSLGGTGISLVGHHEIMLPLLFSGVVEAIFGEKEK